MSLAMRKLTAANKKTAMLWINQTRVNVGVMFGSNEAVPGGKSLPFYASYRIAFRKAGRVTEDIEVTVSDNGKPKKKKIKLTVAQTIRATKEKSKLNAPHREVMFDFDFRAGKVNEWQYLAYKCLDEGLLTVDKGRWWQTSDPSKKYRGIEALKAEWTEEDLTSLLGGIVIVDDNPWSRGNSVAVKKRVVRKVVHSTDATSASRKTTRKVHRPKK